MNMDLQENVCYSIQLNAWRCVLVTPLKMYAAPLLKGSVT